MTPASSFKLTSHTIVTNAHLDSVTKQAAWNSVLDYILFNVILWAAHWGTNTHTHAQIKGFTWSGWWRVNRPEEMEEAHRGEWWEEMMRMMSAEWLASGTDPVRLSAKGVEDTESEMAAERTRRRDRESTKQQEQNDDQCQNSITLWQPTKVSHVSFTSTVLHLCRAATADRRAITNSEVSQIEKQPVGCFI